LITEQDKPYVVEDDEEGPDVEHLGVEVSHLSGDPLSVVEIGDFEAKICEIDEHAHET
jgi:hypothetical protein